jgi:anti-sigma B factor antagonist
MTGTSPHERDLAASDILDVNVEVSRGTAVVTARGEIDLHTAPLLSAALFEAFDGAPNLVVLDLTGVTFLASSGLSVLVVIAKEASERRCSLRLVGGGHPVRRPLQLSGIDSYLAAHGVQVA